MNRLKKSLAAALMLLAIGEFAASRANHSESRDAGPAIQRLSEGASVGVATVRTSGIAGSRLSAPRFA